MGKAAAGAGSNRVVRAVYKGILQYCKALDRTSPDAVNNLVRRLNAHLKVPTPYTSLAHSAIRAYPQRILSESPNACVAAASLFRMPLPEDERAAKAELNYRLEMAFAALKFLNDKYSHVVEQLNDVVKSKDWAIILQSKDCMIEEGAIAIARAADPDLDPAAVHDEINRIARDTLALLSVEDAANRAAHAAAAAAVAVARPKSESFSALEASYLASLDRHHAEEEAAAAAAVRRGHGGDAGSPAAGGSWAGRAGNFGTHTARAAAFARALTGRGSGGARRGGGGVGGAESEGSAEEGGRAAGEGEEREWGQVALEGLNKVMFGELGYRGNREDYYDPRNTLIQEVVARRTGNPITLSVLYMAVARRLGIVLHGVSCPGHFLVRGEGADGQARFIDVFDAGRIMSAQEWKERCLATHQLVEDSDLEPCPPAQIYARMMRNLVNSNMLIGMSHKALLWTERLRVLEAAAAGAVAHSAEPAA